MKLEFTFKQVLAIFLTCLIIVFSMFSAGLYIGGKMQEEKATSCERYLEYLSEVPCSEYKSTIPQNISDIYPKNLTEIK